MINRSSEYMETASLWGRMMPMVAVCYFLILFLLTLPLWIVVLALLAKETMDERKHYHYHAK